MLTNLIDKDFDSLSHDLGFESHFRHLSFVKQKEIKDFSFITFTYYIAYRLFLFTDKWNVG